MSKRWKCSACLKKFSTHLECAEHINDRHPSPKPLYILKGKPVTRSLDREFDDVFAEPRRALGAL